MKKIIALVLALTMVMMVCAAFASEPTEFANGTFRANNGAETTIKATNLESGDSVYYYQLVSWDGTSNGTVEQNAAGGWRLTENGTTTGVSLAEMLNGITAAEAAVIASKLTTGGTLMTTDGTTATATVDPGLYYLRAVATNDDTIYNAAFVSADYYNNGNEVSFLWNIGSSAVVKKSSVTFDKEVNDGADGLQYRDVKPGDTIPYKITTKIPAYGANYKTTTTNPTFTITDTFSTGLQLEGDISVTYGSTTVTESNADVTITPTTGNAGGFVISFAESYLLNENRGVVDVTVTYKGKVNESAITKNVNVMDNTADLEYSNKPGQTEHKEDITRHYDFTIDGDLFGSTDDWSKELIKIGLNEKGEPITKETTTLHGTTYAPLGGASFKLVPVAPTTIRGTDGYLTANSTDLGRVTFQGLDAGTYTLTEETAPTGYVKDSRIYTVIIDPIYVEGTDILKSYSVQFKLGDDVVTTASFTVTASGEGTKEKVTSSGAESATQFIGNTQGSQLPSTGGIGTTIFYILGGVLVIGAAVILVARRKAQD